MRLTSKGIVIGLGITLCAALSFTNTPLSSTPIAGPALAAATPAPVSLPGGKTGEAAPDRLKALQTAPPPESIGPGWAAFSKAADTTDNYRLSVSDDEVKNGKTIHSDLNFIFRKPNYARCQLTAGPLKGSVVVWRGGGKVNAHTGDAHSSIVVVLDWENPRVTSPLGFPCGATALHTQRDYFQTHGKLTEKPGPTIEGQATDEITFVPLPEAKFNVAKIQMYVSRTNHIPVEIKGYDAADKMVLDAKYRNVQLNPGIKYDEFVID